MRVIDLCQNIEQLVVARPAQALHVGACSAFSAA
jgi:hypothetical protein